MDEYEPVTDGGYYQHDQFDHQRQPDFIENNIIDYEAPNLAPEQDFVLDQEFAQKKLRQLQEQILKIKQHQMQN